MTSAVYRIIIVVISVFILVLPVLAQDSVHVNKQPVAVEEDTDFNPHADIKLTESHYVITMELPGVPKEDVTVEVINERQIVISGQKKRRHYDPEHDFHVQERQFGVFTRNIILPTDANMKLVIAELQHGVLRIEVPKALKKFKGKIKRRSIEIN